MGRVRGLSAWIEEPLRSLYQDPALRWKTLKHRIHDQFSLFQQTVCGWRHSPLPSQDQLNATLRQARARPGACQLAEARPAWKRRRSHACSPQSPEVNFPHAIHHGQRDKADVGRQCNLRTHR